MRTCMFHCCIRLTLTISSSTIFVEVITVVPTLIMHPSMRLSQILLKNTEFHYNGLSMVAENIK